MSQKPVFSSKDDIKTGPVSAFTELKFLQEMFRQW